MANWLIRAQTTIIQNLLKHTADHRVSAVFSVGKLGHAKQANADGDKEIRDRFTMPDDGFPDCLLLLFVYFASCRKVSSCILERFRATTVLLSAQMMRG
tara:strand:- start:337 stop:633 length:297 start_codon:yes stop_codon:yes gene_type:complete